MLGGRRFHSTGAAKVNARSPRVLEDLIVGCSRRMANISGRYLLNSGLCTTYGRHTPALILLLCDYIIILDHRSNIII